MVLGDQDKSILAEALSEINGLTPDQISSITTALNFLPSLTILSSSIQAKRRSLSVKKTVEKGIQPLSTSQKALKAQRRTATTPGYSCGIGAGGQTQRLVPEYTFNKRDIPTIRKPLAMEKSPVLAKRWKW